jgi:cytosine deaminase
MALPEAGAIVGAKAEFLAVRADSLEEAVATAPAARHVIHAGSLVATTTVQSSVAAPLIRETTAATVSKGSAL